MAAELAIEREARMPEAVLDDAVGGPQPPPAPPPMGSK